MMRRLAYGVLVATLVALGSGRADEVVTTDGSRLVGTITAVDAGKVTIKTAFAGELKVEQAQVQSIHTDAPRFVQLGSGSTLLGQVQRQGEQTVVNTANGPMDISADTIVALWEEGGTSPEVRKLQAEVKTAEKGQGHWNVEAGVDITGAKGNKDSFGYGGKIRAELKRPEDRLLMTAEGQRSEVDSVVNTSRLKGTIEYEHEFNEMNNWYVRTAVAYDEIKDLDLRTEVAGGYGHYFLRDEKTPHTLLGRIGLVYRHEAYSTGVNKESIGSDLGLEHDWQIRKWVRMRNRLNLTPSFDDFSDYRAEHESSLDLALNETKRWTLRLGLRHEYESIPAAGKVELDTTYFLRLVWRWEQK